MTYLTDLDDCTKALRYIRSAYDIDKQNPDIVFKYAIVLLKSSDYYRAKEKFLATLELDKNYFKAYIGIAECELKLNKPNEALSNLEKCAQQLGDKKDFLMIKMFALVDIFEKDKENTELKDTITQICDKIVNEFGNDEIVEEIKQLHLK